MLFEPAFISQYQVAFTELVRLGKVSSQKVIQGKETNREDTKAERLFVCLQALKNSQLTDAKIEALEYCLRSLNQSLTVPTIQPVVVITPEQIVIPPAPIVNDEINPNAGIFTLTGGDLEITQNSNPVIDLEPGEFDLLGSDLEITQQSYMDLEPGIFNLSGSSLSIEYDPYIPYDLYAVLNEAVGGSPTWRVVFEEGANTKTFNLAGNGDSDTDVFRVDGDVTVTVYKTSNSGITEDAGDVMFSLNGSMQDTQTFLASDNLDGSGSNFKQYTFTGLTEGDSIEITITEG